jgi:glycerol-3-phosphate dehydrogenase (NAD(P)+)
MNLFKRKEPVDTSKVAVIGCGQFGSAITHYLDYKGFDTYSYDPNSSTISFLEKNRTLKDYRHVKFSDNVFFTEDISSALDGAGIIFMAVPSQFYRNSLRKINEFINDDTVIINLTKGLEVESSKPMSQLVKEEIDKNFRYVTLAGGMYARDILNDKVVYADIASNDYSLSVELYTKFSSERFFLRPSSNSLGVEIAGPLKNIGAIMVGMAVSLDIGHSGYCGFMCEYEEEAIKIANHFNAKKDFTKLFAWRGDTATTWFDDESRNRTFGKDLVTKLRQGKTVENILKEDEKKGTVEGYYAAKAMYNIAKESQRKYPILCAVYRVLYEGSSPESEIEGLKKLFMTYVERASRFF